MNQNPHYFEDALLPALRRDPLLRRLLGGQLLSHLGAQCSQVALPWLVLALSADPLAVGTVLAAMLVPRSLLILLGGVAVDRWGARAVLLAAQLANALLLGGLAAAVYSERLQMGGVLLLALALGTATAFSSPAAAALVPQVIRPERQRVANRAMVGMSQLALFAGPPLAGGLIVALGAGPQAGQSQLGLAWAFGLDALGFLASTLSVLGLPALRPAATAESADAADVAERPARPSVRQSLLEGFRAVRADRQLLTSFAYGALVALCAAGPMQVALPVLAEQLGRSWGAGAYGLLLGAFGGGCVGGTLLAGWRPDWRAGTVGNTMLLFDAIIALMFLLLSQLQQLWLMALLLAVSGLLFGFLQNMVYHWTQQRVPPAMLGRAMSLFMLMMLSIAPLSMLGFGALLRWCSPSQVFAVSGAGVLLVVAGAYWHGLMPQLRDRSALAGEAA
ncbi:MFS transporter [Paucibacter sp. APW11]|uniref:MFS transporter n=1 Tax=Roseateles aquae TaxID=3077235 RepID=A0ABU3PC68_9BURK|nr:MFS transporter [Paucibacter sp. APW11]MDT8999922.1 MFS transporter [Paucibacter sp. APW11]